MNTSHIVPEGTFLVFALSPESVLDEAIRRAKSKTRAIAGDQTYLSHPPHLTFYVSAFGSVDQILDRCATVVSTWKKPKLKIQGWHVFQGDVLTGSQTLVCEIADECLKALRSYQAELIQEISGHRSVELSSRRYRPYFDSFSIARQQAVESVGYPFVGEDWIPHLTIASIEPSRWESVWEQLEPEPPTGEFECTQLTLYTLEGDFPKLYREITIEK